MTDPGHRLPEPPPFEYVMPAMRDVQISAVKAEPRALRNFATALPSGGETFAFVVTTEKPIPVRALGPVLYVGQTALTEVTEVGPQTYRFLAHRPQDLERGTPIHLGWSGQKLTESEAHQFWFKP